MVHIRNIEHGHRHYDPRSSDSADQRINEDYEEAEVCPDGHLSTWHFVSSSFRFYITTSAYNNSICVVTIVRMTTLRTGALGKDATYTGSVTLKWTAVETNVGIICACLPLLRPILNTLIPWFAERSRRDVDPRSGYIISSVNTNSTGLNTIDSSKHSEPWSNTDSKNEAGMSETSTRIPDSRNNREVGMGGRASIRKTSEVKTHVGAEPLYDLDSFHDEKHEHLHSSEHVV